MPHTSGIYLVVLLGAESHQAVHSLAVGLFAVMWALEETLEYQHFWPQRPVFQRSPRPFLIIHPHLFFKVIYAIWENQIHNIIVSGDIFRFQTHRLPESSEVLAPPLQSRIFLVNYSANIAVNSLAPRGAVAIIILLMCDVDKVFQSPW